MLYIKRKDVSQLLNLCVIPVSAEFLIVFLRCHTPQNAVALSESRCLFLVLEETAGWLPGVSEMAEEAGSRECQSHLQRDGAMGEELRAGDKEESGELVAPENKGSVLQHFRNRCKHRERCGNDGFGGFVFSEWGQLNLPR